MKLLRYDNTINFQFLGKYVIRFGFSKGLWTQRNSGHICKELFALNISRSVNREMTLKSINLILLSFLFAVSTYKYHDEVVK